MRGGSRPRRAGGGARSGIGILGGLVLLGVAVLLGWAIWAATQQEDELEVTVVGVAEVAADPRSFAGQQVVVSGSITSLVADHGMLLGPERLLVVAAVPTAGAAPGDVAQVVGTATTFDLQAAEEALGVTLSGPIWGRFIGQPVILAERVTVEPATAAGAREVTTARGRTLRDLGVPESLRFSPLGGTPRHYGDLSRSDGVMG